MSRESEPNHLPPGTSPGLRRVALSLSRPVEKFLHIQASSGIVLMLVALIAMAWANSPWASSYEHFLHAPIKVGVGDFVFDRSVHFWVNDILMVVFFFVVGLEIRRELHQGELAELRRAALPIAAALGGMLVPAGLYFALTSGQVEARDGWSVPMATDIAFAVGVFALLGKRVPAALRVLLLALAIIDDIGAILVIALFYTSELLHGGFALAGGGIVLVLLMQRVGIRNPFLYIVPGVLLWAGILWSGIHPTVAGVIMGLLTPAVPWFSREGFVETSERALENVRCATRDNIPLEKMKTDLEIINLAQREAIAPVTRIETALHPWVAFGIMPLFALANAGVPLGDINFDAAGASGVAIGITLGLVLGKPLGILLFSWLAVRSGLATLPRGVTWPGVFVVGTTAGIGFTMALFIGALAFPDPGLLAVSKGSVLAASLIAGVISMVAGLKLLPREQAPDTRDITPGQAESSTEV